MCAYIVDVVFYWQMPLATSAYAMSNALRLHLMFSFIGKCCFTKAHDLWLKVPLIVDINVAKPKKIRHGLFVHALVNGVFPCSTILSIYSQTTCITTEEHPQM